MKANMVVLTTSQGLVHCQAGLGHRLQFSAFDLVRASLLTNLATRVIATCLRALLSFAVGLLCVEIGDKQNPGTSQPCPGKFAVLQCIALLAPL